MTRRTSVSVVVASAMGLLSALSLAAYADLAIPAVLAAVGATLVVGCGTLATREGCRSIALASVGYVLAAGAFLAGIGLALSSALAAPSAAAVVAGGWQSALVLLGVGLASAGGFSLPWAAHAARIGTGAYLVGAGVVGAVLAGTFIALAVGLGGVIVAALPVSAALDGLRGVIVEPSTDRPYPGSLLLLFAVAAVFTALLVDRLPIAEVAPRDRRPAVEAAVTSVSTTLWWGWFVAGLAGVVFALAPEELWELAGAHLPLWVAVTLLESTTAPGPRRFLLWWAVGSFVGVVTISLLRSLSPERVRWVAGTSAYGAGGLVVLAAVMLADPSHLVDLVGEELYRSGAEGAAYAIGTIATDLGAATLVFPAVLAALSIVWLLVAIPCVLGVLRIVPPRTAGAVFVGIGVGLATVGAGLLAGPSPLLFVALALAIVAWDLASYDRGLIADVGVNARTRRVELAHGGATFAVGIGAALLVAAATAIAPVAGDRPSATAGIAALLGTILLLSVLRE